MRSKAEKFFDDRGWSELVIGFMLAGLKFVAQFAVGPIVFFGIPFSWGFLRGAFDNGLLLYLIYDWADTLVAWSPVGQIVLICFLGFSSWLLLRLLSFRDH